MCTYVETPDLRLLIDPGASLGKRFGLLPHPREYVALRECRARIVEAARSADLTTISHYHFDHITPTYTDYVWNWSSLETAKEIYSGKTTLAKDSRQNINFSQRRRGWMFQRTMREFVRRFEVADGKTFDFGKTRLTFSQPVFHGEGNSMLGWVLMLLVEREDESFLYAPDVQGPMIGETLKLIVDLSPRLAMVGGPPVYLSGFSVNESNVKRGLDHLATIVEKIPTTIIDHHLLRTENWREHALAVFEAAERACHKVMTAAEYLGRQNDLLECRRDKLYKAEPPSEEFVKWTKLPILKQRRTKPPI
jgi:predicted metallo-beta-lactamase superfamily hydrolase